MSRLTLLLLVLASVGSALACLETGEQDSNIETHRQEEGRRDAIATPPTYQVYVSPNGRYRFEVKNQDRWQSPTATGKLYTFQNSRLELLWQTTLPQEYGPRFVITGPEGQVLLLDEHINVASPYAVMLLGPTGDTVAQYSFDELANILAVDRADIVEQAHYGWWISASPQFHPETNQVTIATAGKTLSVDLTTGDLTL